jgi:acetyltransferase-like isoleucine patch superfamily enzyme
MPIAERLRQGEGQVCKNLKRSVRRALSLHLPVNNLTSPAWRTLYQAHVVIRESWIWVHRFLWNEPLFRSQCASIGDGFWMEELPYLQGRGDITIGSNVRLSGKPHFAFNNRYCIPKLDIGDDSFVGHLCDFRAARSITIGCRCLIAGGTMIADYDGHPLDAALRSAGRTSPASDIQPVVLGDDVWVGYGAVVLKGVRIGNRAIVGAKSVVTRDVPSDCVVAGNPARVIRRLAEPDSILPQDQPAPKTSIV